MIRVFAPLNLALATTVLLATLAGYLLIPAGAEVAVRWGFDLAPAATLPRNLALLQMPAATALLWGLVWLIARYGNAERRAGQARTLELALPAVTALLAAVQIVIVAVALHL